MDSYKNDDQSYENQTSCNNLQLCFMSDNIKCFINGQLMDLSVPKSDLISRSLAHDLILQQTSLKFVSIFGALLPPLWSK